MWERSVAILLVVLNTKGHAVLFGGGAVGCTFMSGETHADLLGL